MKQETLNQIRLNQRKSIDVEFYNLLAEVFKDRIKGLPKGVPLDCKKILGDEIWNKLDTGERITIGMCAVHMVKNKVLPFKKHKGKHEYPKQYLI